MRLFKTQILKEKPKKRSVVHHIHINKYSASAKQVSHRIMFNYKLSQLFKRIVIKT